MSLLTLQRYKRIYGVYSFKEVIYLLLLKVTYCKSPIVDTFDVIINGLEHLHSNIECQEFTINKNKYI